MSPYKISFQLCSARNLPPQEAVPEGLKEVGYDAVEPWLPDFGDDPAGFRRRIDDADSWRRVGEQLARGTEAARAAGLRVAWHNHEFEYKPLADGSRPIDLVLDAAGDDLGFEIDFAWVMRAWADRVAELRSYAPRILAIQVKDPAPPGTLDEGGWTPMGDGIVDWDVLWPLFPSTPADHLVVEHDNARNWRAVAQRSNDYLIAKGTRSQAASPAADPGASGSVLARAQEGETRCQLLG